ncbi:MAG: pyridoxamine 5'-phosphate oxidase family protein [Paracoccaceae bacterium]
MTSHYRSLMFGPEVIAAQASQGVQFRASRAEADDAPETPDTLTETEAAFIAARDSFYMATVGSGGWPYIQHRGGAAGFVQVLDPRRFAFADFRGNRQYLSLGHLAADDRAAFFFMDYPNRSRLKLLGRVAAVTPEADPALIARLTPPEGRARVERAMLVTVEAFDWNCPQHITPRFTPDEIAQAVQPMRDRIATLEAELAHLKAVRTE